MKCFDCKADVSSQWKYEGKEKSSLLSWICPNRRWFHLFSHDICFLLALMYVVTKTNLGTKCVDSKDTYGSEITVCRPVSRFHLKGFPDCESTRDTDCDYLYDIASGLNIVQERKETNKEICDYLEKKFECNRYPTEDKK